MHVGYADDGPGQRGSPSAVCGRTAQHDHGLACVVTLLRLRCTISCAAAYLFIVLSSLSGENRQSTRALHSRRLLAFGGDLSMPPCLAFWKMEQGCEPFYSRSPSFAASASSRVAGLGSPPIRTSFRTLPIFLASKAANTGRHSDPLDLCRVLFPHALDLSA